MSFGPGLQWAGATKRKVAFFGSLTVKTNWKLVLTQGLLAGSLASIFSAAVMAMAGQRASASAPPKAASRWLEGEKAFGQRQGADPFSTALRFLIHHGAATLWAAAHAALASRTPALRSVPGVLLGAAATGGAAYAADALLTPQRFTLGGEHALSGDARVAVHAALALGLATGALALRGDQTDREHLDRGENLPKPPAAPRIVRHVRAGRI